jgi:branched-subunit amino acid transport protein
MNTQKLTQKSLEALTFAQSTAIERSHQQIGQEHLLYALCAQEGGLIPELITKLGKDPAALKDAALERVESLPGVSGPGREPDKIYVSQDADRALTAAEKQAEQMKDEYVSVEHIFIGLLDAANSGLKELFRKFGIDRNKFLSVLSSVRGNTKVTSDNPEETYDVLSKYGQDRVETAVSGLVSVISLSFVLELVLVKPDWPQIALHTIAPNISGDSLFVAVGMLGATVMPHVIYLHSRLVQSRRNGTPDAMREHLFLEKVDICVAMNIAFVINAAMVIVSAATFHSRGLAVDSIEVAHQTLQPLLGRLSGIAFGTALLASGLSSSTVGVYAGQVILEGFVDVRLPQWVKRFLMVAPAVAIIAMGMNPVSVLVTSQVVLSFALPAAIIPLLLMTSRKSVMGPFVNDRRTSVAGWAICALIISLNAALILSVIAG